MSGCSCPGYTLTYECTVKGGVATVWNGDAFDCASSDNAITFLHLRFMSEDKPATCNNGTIVGQTLRIENNSYTSQVNVTVSPKLTGKSIKCIQDNLVGEMNVSKFTGNNYYILSLLQVYRFH